jgi:AraC-like DNA-binding protein
MQDGTLLQAVLALTPTPHGVEQAVFTEAVRSEIAAMQGRSWRSMSENERMKRALPVASRVQRAFAMAIYICDGHTVDETAAKFGLSSRQAGRVLRRVGQWDDALGIRVRHRMEELLRERGLKAAGVRWHRRELEEGGPVDDPTEGEKDEESAMGGAGGRPDSVAMAVYLCDGHTVDETAAKFGLSSRQAGRVLRRVGQWDDALGIRVRRRMEELLRERGLKAAGVRWHRRELEEGGPVDDPTEGEKDEESAMGGAGGRPDSVGSCSKEPSNINLLNDGDGFGSSTRGGSHPARSELA